MQDTRKRAQPDKEEKGRDSRQGKTTAGAAPDEGFLARMMRATASSASKVHHAKEEVKPKAKVAARRVSGKADKNSTSTDDVTPTVDAAPVVDESEQAELEEEHEVLAEEESLAPAEVVDAPEIEDKVEVEKVEEAAAAPQVPEPIAETEEESAAPIDTEVAKEIPGLSQEPEPVTEVEEDQAVPIETEAEAAPAAEPDLPVASA